MTIFDMFETDTLMETGGIWIDYGVNGGKFLVARSGGANTKFAKVLEFKMRPHRRQMDSGKLDNEVANRILMESFVEAALLDWDGVQTSAGETLTFSKDNAIQLFTDLPELFADLRDQSAKMANYQAAEVEADSGN